MKLLHLITALLVSVSAFAENAIIASCTEGKGCTFELSDFDKNLFDPDFSRPLESDDIIVYGLKKDGTSILYLSKASRETIDRTWGGDGFTQIALFNPQIQPNNGTWKVSYGASTGNECYGIGDVGTFIRNLIAPGTAGQGIIQFDFPFNPKKLFPSREMKWRKTGYNTYRGLLDFNSSAQAGMRMSYHIKIISPKKIETFYEIEVNVPVKGKCIGKVPVTFTYAGVDEDDDSGDTDPVEDDDLMDVRSNGDKDDLMEVKPKDELLPVKPGQKPKPKVERLDQSKVERIKD